MERTGEIVRVGEVPLAYETPVRVSWWQRIAGGAAVGASHIVATVVVALAVAVPALIALAVVLLMWVVGMVRDLGQVDGPPPIVIPVVVLVGGGVGATAIVVGSVIVALLMMVAGITADAARRAMRFPVWLVPSAWWVINLMAWPVVYLCSGDGWKAALWHGVVMAVICAFLFTVYWVAMCCSEGILRLGWWGTWKGFGWLIRWWKKRGAAK